MKVIVITVGFFPIPSEFADSFSQVGCHENVLLHLVALLICVIGSDELISSGPID